MEITKGLIMTGLGAAGILLALIWLSIAMKTHKINKKNGFVKEHVPSAMAKITAPTEETETTDMKTLRAQNSRVTKSGTELLGEITETAASPKSHSGSTELLIEKTDDSQVEDINDATEGLIEDSDKTELLKS